MDTSAPGPASAPVQDKLTTAREAVGLIRDGDTVVIGGFVTIGFPEELVLALEERFVDSSEPRGLTAVFGSAHGDKEGRGLDRLCHDGLLAGAIGSHFAMSPELGKKIVSGEIEGYNIPQGVLCQLYRDTAAGKPGMLTTVGLGTFVDPRHGGGKLNDRSTSDRVRVLEVDGEEYLFFRRLDADVALLRGTTADADGNITVEREALVLESLAMATAVHNAGGLVVVQVERLAERGSLSPQQVRIPGVLVDCVVVARPEHHGQSFGTDYAPAFSGEVRTPMTTVDPLELDPRKVIARRAALELRPGAAVNLGVGMPEGVANVAHEEHMLEHLTLTSEGGVIGGMPAGGLDFGAGRNAQAVIDQPSQFDFYDGGGLDIAFLGMAQVDRQGNVNVSRFGPQLAGSGGFIEISQNAKTVCFLGSFAAPCRSSVSGGGLRIDDGDAVSKFVADVEQRTFSGAYAAASGRRILYITERCVFALDPDGRLRLTEVAPDVDVDKDVLALIDFDPVVDGEPALMDSRIFRNEPMGLARDLLDVPMEARFSHDTDRDILFIDLVGLSLNTNEDIAELEDELGRRLGAAGRQVRVVVDYGNFRLASDLEDEYAAFQRRMEPHYTSISRYSTSSFSRLKLGAMMSRRGMSPHVHDSRDEAVSRLDRAPDR